jgi:uncharacterized protein (DUF983 family)
MSALAVAPSLFDQPPGGRTLDDVIVEAWEALAAGAEAECPVCSGALVPQYDAYARPVAGRCGSCASSLS